MQSSTPPVPDSGVFVVKGDQITIPSISFYLDENGNPTADPIILHTRIDMSPYWLNIAKQHLRSAEAAHKKLMIAKSKNDDEQIARYLKQESAAGMQAIMASAIVLDAYYASLKDYVKIPKELSDQWRKNGTARYKQVAEVMRMGFALTAASSKSLRDILKQNFELRDQAVHPSSAAAQPYLHVELNKFTDWRYASFRFENARKIYGLTLSIVFKTASIPPPKSSKQFKDYCSDLVAKLKFHKRSWVRRYGALL